MTSNKPMTLDEVIDKLQAIRQEIGHGNVIVDMDIDEEDYLPDSRGICYIVKDILTDERGVTLYNY